MANKKITELNAASSLAATDVVPVVDVSADETKKITATDLFRTLPDGTAAAPALAFSSDQANGVYLAGTDTVGISTGGTQRVTVDGSGNVTISGDLQVNGATTTVQSTTVTIDDKNIELGSVASPSNTTADGGGITLKGASDKTLKWINSTGCWTFNQPMNFNDHVRIDSSGNVGIGASSPVTQLHIQKATGGTAGVQISNSTHGSTITDGLFVGIDNSLAYLYNYENIPLLFGTNNAERMRIDSSGRVGIGTSSPSVLLELKAAEPYIQFTDTAAASGYSRIMGTHQGALVFSADDSNSVGSSHLRFDVDGSERLRIDSSGDVGVGSTTPNKNNWNKAITLQGGSNCAYELSDNGTLAAAFALQGDDRIELINFRSGPLTFKTNNTERLRIDSSGNVGIGTTAPSVPLTVNSTTDHSDIAIFHAGGGTPNRGLKISTFSNTNSNAGVELDAQHSTGAFKFSTGGTERLRIDSSGNVGIGTTSPAKLAHISNSYSAPTGGHNAETFLLVSNGAVNGNACGIEIQSGRSGSSFIDFGDTDNADQGRIVYSNSANTLAHIVNGSVAHFINSSGNVGLGTTTPSAPLHITNASPKIILTDSDDSTDISVSNIGGAGVYETASDSLFKTSSAERMRIDSSGRLLVGTSSNQGGGRTMQVANTSSEAGIEVFRYTTIAPAGPVLNLTRSNSDTLNTNTLVDDNDALGYIQWKGANGSSYNVGAEIICFVDGTPGVDDMPSRLTFGTTADGSSSPTERMRIDSSGDVTITSTGSLTIPVGTTAERPSSPAQGMIRRNTTDSAFEGYTGNSWAPLGGGATGGGSDAWVVETDQTVTTSYELGAGKHGTTVSPTINSGATVTVPSGAILVIL